MNIHDLEHDESRAYFFAEQAHSGQVRMGTGEPYIVHPKRVALELKRRGWDSAMVQAGFLHDTLEDTKVTLPELEVEFGSDVSGLVYELTTPEYDFGKAPSGTPSRRRRWRYNQLITPESLRLFEISERAKVIKTFDTMDNVSHIRECGDFEFERDYVELKWALASTLYQTLNKSLYTEALRVIRCRYDFYFPRTTV